MSTANSYAGGRASQYSKWRFPGTTTYTDMYYFEDTVAEVTKEAGLRGVLGETVIGFPAPDFKTPQAALAATDHFLKQYADDPLIVPAVVPHSIYTVPNDALQAGPHARQSLSEAAADSPVRDQSWRTTSRSPSAR